MKERLMLCLSVTYVARRIGIYFPLIHSFARGYLSLLWSKLLHAAKLKINTICKSVKKKNQINGELWWEKQIYSTQKAVLSRHVEPCVMRLALLLT